MTVTAVIAVAGLLGLALAAGALAWLRHRLRRTSDQADLERRVDRAVAKFMARDRSMALVVGIHTAQRSVVKGYGSVVPGAEQPPDGATVFQIASVSKLFTAGLLQALCDEGVVTLDATLGELIGGRWPLAPQVRDVTLRQLATHRSGFPSVPKALETEASLRAGGGDLMADPYSHLGAESVFGYLATAPDKTRAGRFNYSNYGMGLLGHVLELVTGQTYEALVLEKVLAPLGMHHTRIALTADMAARLAPGHDAKGRPAGCWHFKALAGAGGFASSAQDMLTFVAASLTPGAKAATAFDAMRRPQFGGQTGLGWIQPGWVDRFVGNDGIVWHNGMVGGYASYLAIDAATRSGIVVLVNRAVDVTLLGLLLTRHARTQSWPSTTQPPA